MKHTATDTATARVLHLFSDMGAGGAEKMVLATSGELERRGIYSCIVCPEESYLHRISVEKGLRHRLLKFNGTFDIPALARLMRIIRKDNITILHAHQGKVFWPCVYAKWLSRGAVRTVFHRRVSMPHHFYSRGHYRHADAVIAISDAVARVLTGRDRVAQDKLRVVYNGCDFARFNPGVSGADVRRRHGIREDAIVIGTVGAMNPPKGKGQQYLIEAAARLRREFPNVVCLVVGTGPWEEALKAWAAARGYHDGVIFAGYQEKVEHYMAAMDIFTLNSWDTEGFGQVMVEAQALGKPVIGTRIGGIPETFGEGISGVLVPPEDPLALAAALRPLVARPFLRIEMGQAGIRFVQKTFTNEVMADNILSVYRELHERR